MEQQKLKINQKIKDINNVIHESDVIKEENQSVKREIELVQQQNSNTKAEMQKL